MAERFELQFSDDRIDQRLRLRAGAVACAHRDDLFHGKRDTDSDMLGQHETVAGETARGEGRDVAPFQTNAAGGRTQVAG